MQEFREVKLSSLAHEMRLKETTTGQNLALLVERGYLDVRPIERRSRAYRLLWTRRTGRAMAA